MSSDTDKFSGNTTDGGIDPAYAAMMAKAQSAPPAEAETGRSYPRSDYFVGNFDGFSFREAFEEKLPQLRIEGLVKEGPDGSVGIHYSGDLGLTPSRYRRVNKDDKDSPLRPATEAELAEAVDTIIAIASIIQQALGLDTPMPESPTEAGVTKWLAGAKIRKPQIVFGGYDKNGFATLNLRTLKAPGAQGRINKKPVAGKTAIEVAREQLAKAALKAASGSGGRRTVASQTPTATQSFD